MPKKGGKGMAHVGETPVQVAEEVKKHAISALNAIEKISVTKNKAEFERLQTDVKSYYALAFHFAYKVEAALAALRYKYSNNTKDLEDAKKLLDVSVTAYRELATITSKTYLYANSMQTQQRKIPMRGVNATYKHWSEMLPVFENELAVFQRKIDSLKTNTSTGAQMRTVLLPATVAINQQFSTLDSGMTIFSDSNLVITKIAPELKGLQALKVSYRNQLKEGSVITFSCSKPAKLLVGYFQTQRAAFTTDTFYLKTPELETNASADDYGQADIKISNALALEGMPSVNVHVYTFKEGQHTLRLPKGVCLLLGFVDGQQVVPVYDAKLMSNDKSKNIDWLFE